MMSLPSAMILAEALRNTVLFLWKNENASSLYLGLLTYVIQREAVS